MVTPPLSPAMLQIVGGRSEGGRMLPTKANADEEAFSVGAASVAGAKGSTWTLVHKRCSGSKAT